MTTIWSFLGNAMHWHCVTGEDTTLHCAPRYDALHFPELQLAYKS